MFDGIGFMCGGNKYLFAHRWHTHIKLMMVYCFYLGKKIVYFAVHYNNLRCLIYIIELMFYLGVILCNR